MFLIIYILPAIILITLAFLYMKYEIKDTETPNEDKLEPKDYTIFIVASLIPVINDIIFAIIIIGSILYFFNNFIAKYMKNLKKEAKTQYEIEMERTKNLPKALISAGYFKNENEIKDLVDGYLVGDKLSS